MSAIGTLLDSTVRGRCPSCREVSMFSGYYDVHPSCPRCDVRFNASEGAWLGAVALGYAIGALTIVIFGLVEVTVHPFDRLGLHPLWSVTATALIATAIGYRFAKGAWYGLLYLYGFVVPEGASEGGEAPPR